MSPSCSVVIRPETIGSKNIGQQCRVDSFVITGVNHADISRRFKNNRFDVAETPGVGFPEFTHQVVDRQIGFLQVVVQDFAAMHQQHRLVVDAATDMGGLSACERNGPLDDEQREQRQASRQKRRRRLRDGRTQDRTCRNGHCEIRGGHLRKAPQSGDACVKKNGSVGTKCRYQDADDFFRGNVNPFLEH